MFNPKLLVTQHILHTYVFWFCYVSLNIPIMQGCGTNYVLRIYFSLPSAMSSDTSATAAENLVSYFKIYSLLRPLRIQCERKGQSDTASPSVLYRRLICPCKYFSLQWWLMAKNTTLFLLNYGWNLNLHSLLDVDNNVIYGLCRRNMLLQLSKLQFLSVMLVIHFSEERP